MSNDTASGKGSNDLKSSDVCKMEKSCQKTLHSSHEEECKNRAHEQLPKQDHPLFKEDCPICFLPLPVSNGEIRYQSCCGKLCCSGCAYQIKKVTTAKLCPFCRAPPPTSNEESIKRLKQRIVLNDPEAYCQLGHYYLNGTQGLPLDHQKGFELVHKAAELGLVEAHTDIARYYYYGRGVEVDMEKTKYHYEMAAKGGHVVAMFNLGAIEYNAGNNARAKKHWMVAASAGYDRALNQIRMLFMAGHATKDEFERALRAHKDSVDEMKSDMRDAARAHSRTL